MPFVANVLFVVIACLIYMKSKISSEDIPVFLRGDDLLTVCFCFFFIFDTRKGVGKAIAFSGIVVDEYVSAGTIMPTHRMNHRPPKVANGVKTLTKIADPEYAIQKVEMRSHHIW